jgi:2-polyprenyl-6-methoxyphenol hydroxylase-like FAD-dependent oxidoreductase
MSSSVADIVIVGAGPVGLMCAHLGYLCGLRIIIVDKSNGPLKVGKADALNARTLQFLEIAGLFDDLYPLGKKCNTSSVWAEGRFISRQSSWWDELEGCFHKHFLMLGQSFLETLLDAKLTQVGAAVKRACMVEAIELVDNGCLTRLSNGETLQSSYVIGADGSRSFVRNQFKIPFQITRPPIIWAVIDGIVVTDFPKVPEIIVFQSDTSDVAWIPREGELDRFYVRMDTENFTIDQAIFKINRAMKPHRLHFKEISWFSQFSVKESVAENFRIHQRVFLAGDACHIHSVNGGQGLNTGLADAVNLMWKLNMVINFEAPFKLLDSYETERKPVALSVVETSGELVRATKYSDSGAHALDYVKIVQKRAGNITGMGIRYGDQGLRGRRLYDFPVFEQNRERRLYSLLDYTQFTLLVFDNRKVNLELPKYLKLIQIVPCQSEVGFWTTSHYYTHLAVLVRPDSYIAATAPVETIETILSDFFGRI